MSKTIEVVGVGNFTPGAAALNVPVPSGIQRNDLLIILIMSANQTISISSAGWTQIGDQTVQAVGTAGGATGVRLGVYYKFAGATEGNVGVNDSGNINAAQIIAFRYVNRTNPFIATSGGAQASAAAAPTLPAITTTIPNALILFALANGRDLATPAGGSFSNLTNANLNTITERMDETTATQTGGGVAAWTAYAALRGNIGTSTTTKNGAWTEATAYLTIGLRPKARRFSVS